MSTVAGRMEAPATASGWTTCNGHGTCFKVPRKVNRRLFYTKYLCSLSAVPLDCWESVRVRSERPEVAVPGIFPAADLSALKLAQEPVGSAALVTDETSLVVCNSAVSKAGDLTGEVVFVPSICACPSLTTGTKLAGRK